MSFNIPKIDGTLPRLVSNGKHSASEKKKKREMMQENTSNGNTSLAITKCNGETKSNLAEIINHFTAKLNHINLHFLGYPTNLDFNYEALAPLFHFHLNNAGDPFIGSSFSLNSTEFEVCVLDWFAKLFEIDKSEYWGYVTSGGTEGNFHGILLGREQFPDGILYISEDSHYSIFKIAKICRMQCVKVKTLISGEIDCVDLKVLLLAHKDRPAIINLNIGTTMKGAIDDIDLVVQTLEESGFCGRFYIHCDGALFGIMLPFIKQAPRPSFKKPIGSISISGHKFLGCPNPCGVTITRLEHINSENKDVEYIASRDETISGSRSGHSVIFLWYALQEKGLMGLEKEVHTCIKNAHYLFDQLRNVGIGAMLNEFSNTVVFERPLDDEFSRRWHLACKGNIAHVVVVKHVTIEMLDCFVSEFSKNRAIWFKDALRKPPCIASDIGAQNCACNLHKSLCLKGCFEGNNKSRQV